MLTKLRYALQGSVVLLIISTSTIVITVVLFLLSFVKFLAPVGKPRNFMNRLFAWLAELWISINKTITGFYRHMEWDIRLPQGLDRKGRYLVFCNHQSWVDIVVLQHCLNRRAPFMRFLLKQQLIWVPFLGFAWWALDMAFLKRYSREELLRNPSLAGKDLENAARACEKLKHVPVSMMTFPEGTRFTPEKRRRQNSPHLHLLKPRFGGIGQVLYSFDDALEWLIDVTIVYPQGTPTAWQLISGQLRKIIVDIRLRPIDADIRGYDFRQDR
ncbi:MAG: acetyltransferase, partial [Xanthomonadales bacterium]|nr:acetyltransferase [Xanthomonadales bacterium]